MRATTSEPSTLFAVRMAERWVVCGGALREVALDGSVPCPRDGDVDLERCLECRFLEDSSAGWRRQPCGVTSD
jgi:predicted RNA-binding Zn-ribbon protein involved in translation (DUF1610 family)